MSKLDKRVQNGMHLLDEVQPGWIERVNVEALDQINDATCVAGQVYGDYQTAVRVLKFDKPKEVLYGFYCDYAGYTCNYDSNLLTNAWKQAILKRRSN